MALTSAEEARVEAIEEAINRILTWIDGLASKAQLRQLTLLKQTEIDQHTQRITALEAQVTLLQNQFKNL